VGVHLGLVGIDLWMGIGGGVSEKVSDSVGEANGNPGVL
jgi:hypothetical protein